MFIVAKSANNLVSQLGVFFFSGELTEFNVNIFAENSNLAVSLALSGALACVDILLLGPRSRIHRNSARFYEQACSNHTKKHVNTIALDP